VVIHGPITFSRHDGSMILGSSSCRLMARLTVLMMVVVVVGIGSAARCAAGSGKRPAWVTAGTRGIEFYFRHHPRVARVEWGVGAKRRWVRVIFVAPTTCSGCSAPAGVPLERGWGGTMFLKLRSDDETEFDVWHETRV
jgi:hypothetical protein